MLPTSSTEFSRHSPIKFSLVSMFTKFFMVTTLITTRASNDTQCIFIYLNVFYKQRQEFFWKGNSKNTREIAKEWRSKDQSLKCFRLFSLPIVIILIYRNFIIIPTFLLLKQFLLILRLEVRMAKMKISFITFTYYSIQLLQYVIFTQVLHGKSRHSMFNFKIPCVYKVIVICF